MRLYQAFQERLALDTSIHGQTRRILSYLISVADFANHVPGPSVIAEKMGIRQPHVSRAYAELKRVEALIVKDGDFFLSPLLCWKGSEKQLEEAYQKLLAPPVRALPPGMQPALKGR